MFPPNVWFLVSGVLLGTSYFIDTFFREIQQQHYYTNNNNNNNNSITSSTNSSKLMTLSKLNTIYVRTVLCSRDNTTEYCTYHYHYED